VRALKQAKDCKALRLVRSQIWDAVGEATTKLELNLSAVPVRLPTPQRWPCIQELRIFGADLAAVEALGSGTWAALRTLRILLPQHPGLDTPSARALAAAMRRMPALRALELLAPLSDAAAEELFRASGADGAPRLPALRSLAINSTIRVDDATLLLAAVRMLAASGWRLEELRLRLKAGEAAAGVAALVAAPTFALRCLRLWHCGLDAAALLSLAHTPWPLEELEQ
jgi:hypothetical protein